MTELYETFYGVFNHVANSKMPPSKKRPLAGIAFHKGEDFTEGSLLEDVIETFIKYSIKDLFGYNFSQFMKLPVDIVELIIKSAKKKYEENKTASNNAENALKQSLAKSQTSGNELLQNKYKLNNKHKK